VQLFDEVYLLGVLESLEVVPEQMAETSRADPHDRLFNCVLAVRSEVMGVVRGKAVLRWAGSEIDEATRVTPYQPEGSARGIGIPSVGTFVEELSLSGTAQIAEYVFECNGAQVECSVSSS
jgi:hypothetical protein